MLKIALETIKVACVFALLFYGLFVVLVVVQPRQSQGSEINY